jgi:hypothetical protein
MRPPGRERESMKQAFIALAGLALLTGAPATARALPTAAPVVADPLDARIDTAWADLNSKWMAGTITDREFQAMTDLLIQATDAVKATYPDAGTIRYRLQAALDDLKARAQAAMKQAGFADSVYEQFIDFRLNRELNAVKIKAAAAGLSDADLQALVDQINKRAEAAKDDLSTAATVAAALRAQVDELKAKAAKSALAATDFKALELSLATDRQYRTAFWLRQRALAARLATHFDYVRVADTTKDRAQVAAISADILKTYLSSIDRLEALYGNNQLTKDEFDKWMTQLQINFRVANAGAPK